MKKFLVIACAATLALLTASTAGAALITVVSTESMTFAGPLNAGGAIGDVDNTIIFSPGYTGGFLANRVLVSGTLQEVMSSTWGSEADIVITHATGFETAQSPGPAGTYVGPLTVGPGATTFGTPFDPSTITQMEFIDSFDDGPGIDQRWDSVTLEFQEFSVSDGNFALGSLPSDATQHLQPGSNGNSYYTNLSGFLDFFTLDLADGVNAGIFGGGFLDIEALDALTGATIDTEIAIYDSAGNLIATNDDGGGGLYSQLSFGFDDPFALGGSDTNAGDHGVFLAPGSYTVVVGGFNTDFTALIGDIVPGTSEGDYDLSIAYFRGVPEPGSLSLVGLCGLAFLRRRRRQG